MIQCDGITSSTGKGGSEVIRTLVNKTKIITGTATATIPDKKKLRLPNYVDMARIISTLPTTKPR